MDKALLFDPFKESWTEISAEQYTDRLKDCPEARQTDELIDPASESPVIYRQPYWRNGSEKRVKECFAVAAGCGNNDHIFNPKIKLSIQQHIAQGHKILLNLN